MILFDDIIQGLIGNRKFRKSVPNDIKEETIRLYSKIVDSLFVGNDITEQIEEFKEFLKTYLPCVYEKANSLRFERDSYKELFQALNIKKGILDSRKPNIEDVNVAFSKILHLNPFIFEVEEGFYITDDGYPYVHLEIADIGEVLLELIDETFDFPNIRADLVYANEPLSKIHRLQLPTYMAPLMVRDLIQNPNPQGVADVLIPLVENGKVLYQNENGLFTIPVSQYAMEAKTMGLDAPMFESVGNELNTDRNLLMNFAQQLGADNSIMEAIYTYGLGSFDNTTHRSLFSSMTYNFDNSPIGNIISKFEEQLVNPIILEQVRDVFLASKNQVNWKMFEGTEEFLKLKDLLVQAQIATIYGVGAALKKIAKHYGYDKVYARVGIYNNTQMVEGLVKTGINVLHIMKGGL